MLGSMIEWRSVVTRFFSLTLPAKMRLEKESLIVEGIDYLRIDLWDSQILLGQDLILMPIEFVVGLGLHNVISQGEGRNFRT